MKNRAGILAVLALGVLLFSGSILADQESDCLNYSDYMHVVSNVPAEARFLDQLVDLFYVSSLQVIDVSLGGDAEVVGSFAGLDGDVSGLTVTTENLYVIYSAAAGTGFNGLAVYDLVDRRAPALIASLELPQFMTQMRIIGDRAYLRNDQGQMTIVDISDPALPIVQGSIGAGWLDSFDLNGDFMYAVDRVRNDIVVVDVTDPMSLQVDYRLALNDVISISFNGGYGYFLYGSSGTDVLQFTAPDQYTTANHLADMNRPVVIDAGLAYMYGKPMQVYELSDPVHPLLRVTVPFVVHSGLLDRTRAVLGLSNSFAVMDLSNTMELPGVVATVDVASTLTAMFPAGDDLVTLSRMGLETFDTSECIAPVAMGSLMWQDQVRGHVLADGYLYTMIAGSSFGNSVLKVFDLTDMSAPTEVASKNMMGEFSGLTAVGDYLYTSEFGALIVLDISDPLVPTMFSRTENLGFAPLTAVMGTRMLVADGTMLRHFDVSDATSPVLLTEMDTGVEAIQIVMSNTAAYFTHHGGVNIYEVTALGTKNLLCDLTVPGIVDGMVLDGNMLYVEGSGIFMIDVTDPALPMFSGNLGYVVNRATHLTVMGACLYFDQYAPGDRGRINIAMLNCVADDNGDMGVVIDIKPGSDVNPINCRNDHGVIPVAILTTDDFDALTVDHNTVRFGPGEAMEVHRKGGHGHGRGHGESEIKRHEEDVDDDGDMDLVFHFSREDADIACGDTEAWLTGETFAGEEFSGWDVVWTVPGHGGDDDDDDGDDDGDDDNKNRLAGGPTMSLAPNPFNPMTTIAFSLPASQHLRVEVYDVTGRRVAVVADEVFGAGDNRVVWRGTDNSGRPAASGVYFMRLTGAGVNIQQRAVLLK